MAQPIASFSLVLPLAPIYGNAKLICILHFPPFEILQLVTLIITEGLRFKYIIRQIENQW